MSFKIPKDLHKDIVFHTPSFTIFADEHTSFADASRAIATDLSRFLSSSEQLPIQRKLINGIFEHYLIGDPAQIRMLCYSFSGAFTVNQAGIDSSVFNSFYTHIREKYSQITVT